MYVFFSFFFHNILIFGIEMDEVILPFFPFFLFCSVINNMCDVISAYLQKYKLMFKCK